jgi:hypothetical protein
MIPASVPSDQNGERCFLAQVREQPEQDGEHRGALPGDAPEHQPDAALVVLRQESTPVSLGTP